MIESGSPSIFDRMRNPVEQRVPKGWMTVTEIMKKSGMSRSTTDRTVRALFAEGKLERRMFRIETTRGLFPVPHYKEV